MHELYRKSITLCTGWAHTHSLWQEPLELITAGRFDPTPVTSADVTFDEVAEALCEPFTNILGRSDALAVSSE